MPHAQVVAQRFFQLLVEGTAIGEDLVFLDLFKIRKEVLKGRQHGLGDIHRLVFEIRLHRDYS